MISGNFPGYLETFQIIRKLPKLSGHFPDYLETFQFTRKLSRTSGNFPDYLETFQTIWKLSRLSGNFPDHPETPQCNFKGCAQKLSGRAKTFWMAMPRWFLGLCSIILLCTVHRALSWLSIDQQPCKVPVQERDHPDFCLSIGNLDSENWAYFHFFSIWDCFFFYF